ncbi:hypothetical protein CNMCM5793_006676 [Aspergillus hiratsukae]|uniref:Uncharacterized protein n=1 Tax=Aspergillus hiratsukae TaxID=1194566 RepID=A0A8H6PHN5_9EURO|nr:hypothetical protein CNMCM5793_006676 [Aspergillus hiratsukae]
MFLRDNTALERVPMRRAGSPSKSATIPNLQLETIIFEEYLVENKSVSDRSIAEMAGAAVKGGEASKSALTGDTVVSALGRASLRDDLASLDLRDAGEALGSGPHVAYEVAPFSVLRSLWLMPTKNR